jgi:O-methyltransferase
MFLGLGRRFDEFRLSPLAREVRRRNLTYLSPAKLRALEEDLKQVRAADVPGDFLEFGVACGGAGILIASHAEAPFAFHGYDVFPMIPPPRPQDDARSPARYDEISAGASAGIGGEPHYGYVEDLYERLCATFAEFGLPVDGARIHLHLGRFEETLEPSRTRVAFAHIDCDRHAAVIHCLAALRGRIAPGGRIVLDGYQDYDGCRGTVEQFLAQTPGKFRLLRERPSAALIRL